MHWGLHSRAKNLNSKHLNLQSGCVFFSPFYSCWNGLSLLHSYRKLGREVPVGREVHLPLSTGYHRVDNLSQMRVKQNLMSEVKSAMKSAWHWTCKCRLVFRWQKTVTVIILLLSNYLPILLFHSHVHSYSWTAIILTQLSNSLRGASIIPDRTRAQSHRPAPLCHFRCQLQDQVVTCFSLAVNQRFVQPPYLDSINLL